MKKLITGCIVLIACYTNGFGQSSIYHFDNEFGKYKNRNDYFNWKVFLIADNNFKKKNKED